LGIILDARTQAADIALIISDLGGGGAQRVLSTLANAWADKGKRVCVITLADESSDFFSLDAPVQRIASGGIHQSSGFFEALSMNFRRIRNLRRSIKSSGAPIVVSFVGTTNILTIMASIGLGLRVIISERNDPSRQSLGRIWDFLRRKLYKYADRVTANSRGVLETLSVFTPRSKLYYAPNPLVTPDEIHKRGKSPLSILAVGRLHEQKAYDVLLPAFAQIAPHAPDWCLEILGDGPLRDQLHQQAGDLNITDRISWHGRVSQPFQFYSSSAIFVLASRYEGTPNAMLEAMASGLPVIVTDASPGPLEFVEDGVSGLVVPAENKQALADAMLRLINDADLRRSLSDMARLRVIELELPNALKTWEQAIGFDDL
jgi:glycosyltransferase involved in cell wall biosynthesis